MKRNVALVFNLIIIKILNYVDIYTLSNNLCNKMETSSYITIDGKEQLLCRYITERNN